MMKKYLAFTVFCSVFVALSGCAAQPGDSPSDVSSESATVPTAPETVTPPDCPPDITLPEGVDPWLVCTAPANTVVLPSFMSDYIGSEWNGFRSPDHNIACSWFEGRTVSCKAVTMSGVYPDDPSTVGADINCQRGLSVGDSDSGMTCNGGIMVLDEIPELDTAPILEIGQTTLSTDYPYPWTAQDAPLDPVACSSQDDGVTCWNTGTSHGIKISSDAALFW